jgi:hypothetical protein
MQMYMWHRSLRRTHQRICKMGQNAHTTKTYIERK